MMGLVKAAATCAQVLEFAGLAVSKNLPSATEILSLDTLSRLAPAATVLAWSRASSAAIWKAAPKVMVRVEQARRLKELEKENARLKKLVADITLDNAILKEAARGNF